MQILKVWQLHDQDETGVALLVEDRHLLQISVLEETLFRVQLLKEGAYRLDKTWTIAPGSDIPVEGRLRASLEGFSCPSFELEQRTDEVVLSTSLLRVTIQAPLALTWEARACASNNWHTLAQDRPTGAYMLGRKDHGHSHFLLRNPSERYYGLGEKAGELERSGRRYEMRNLDAMGYDARSTDPLYKHIPFTMTRTQSGLSYGLYYDNLASCWFDLGNELDNYHQAYRSYRAEDGDLDYYLMLGPDLLGVSKQQVQLTGGTAFPPRWSLGYSGSTMSYTDADNAQERLETFLSLVDEHDIPCDSFQLSSGYTSIGDKRYVFNWNYDKVPDPAGLAQNFLKAGIHLVANIKPCLLQDHPRYGEVAQKGLFVRDSETGQPERSVFWDDEGSHLDFSNPDTQTWWQEGVTSALLNVGIGSTWNDNNEYEIWDREAKCNGFGTPIDIALIRPVQPLLMTRGSEVAQKTHAPDRRPYLISRSGCPGMQRYAQTWTGDNRTAWESLKYNIPMGLGLSMSGFYNIGHDVGGFAGLKPEPELFVRWVQNGIFHPRFTIHSWNDDGTTNEPWMYPEVTGLVRDAIKLRYQLLPYLYTLLYRAVKEHEPMIRPTFLDHEGDESCFLPTDDFMLGEHLLVANVVEPGATERSVYLPDNHVGWYDFWSGDWFEGGQHITLPVDLSSIPLFVKAGSLLPFSMGANRAHGRGESQRQLALYPLHKGLRNEAINWLYEDDGDAADALAGNHRLTRFSLWHQSDRLDLNWQHSGGYDSPVRSFQLINATNDERPVHTNGSILTYGSIHEF
jgi:alpha-glucosidase